MQIKLSHATKKTIAYLTSALGAAGGSWQNIIAVEMFLRAIFTGLTSVSRGLIYALAIGAGGVCSGAVNYFINVDLLEGFLERITSDSVAKPMTGWRKFRYYAGIFVFSVTGVLFGMTAFTFSMATPLAALALASGVFVAVIMTIQEIETWLQSFDDPELDDKTSLSDIFKQWKSTLTFSKACGHLIAAGNVLALSLLFTLGLAEVLVTLQVAAFTAFVIGLSVAFTFGAFTEFYFYNFFLAKFCHQFQTNWEGMKASHYASFGLFCVGMNAFVNTALTYSGVGLLTSALVAAGIALPPVAVITALSVTSAFFAGSASLLLGMDFWMRKQGTCSITLTTLPVNGDVSNISLGGFNYGYVSVKNALYYCDKKAGILTDLGLSSTQLAIYTATVSSSKVAHVLSNAELTVIQSVQPKSQKSSLSGVVEALVASAQPMVCASPVKPSIGTRGLSIFSSSEVGAAQPALGLSNVAA